MFFRVWWFRCSILMQAVKLGDEASSLPASYLGWGAADVKRTAALPKASTYVNLLWNLPTAKPTISDFRQSATSSSQGPQQCDSVLEHVQGPEGHRHLLFSIANTWYAEITWEQHVSQQIFVHDSRLSGWTSLLRPRQKHAAAPKRSQPLTLRFEPVIKLRSRQLVLCAEACSALSLFVQPHHLISSLSVT